MMYIKKVIIVVVALTLCWGYAYSRGSGLSVSGGIALPIGDFNDAAGAGFGGKAEFLFSILGGFSFGAELDYIMFGGKSIDLGVFGEFKYDYSMIPIVAKVYYNFPSSLISPYAMFGFGLTITKVTIETTIMGETNKDSDSESDFGICVGGGIRFSSLDINASYNQVFTEGSDLQYLGISLGYVLSF